MATEKVKTGIAGLDVVLDGGFLRGATVLVQGLPGAGKTTLGLQFIYYGATQFDETGLIVSFEEFPTQMLRDARNFGWDFEPLVQSGKVKIMASSPQAFYQQIRDPNSELNQLLTQGKIQRVLIDSLSHFQRLTNDPVELREILNSLLNRLRQSQVTALLTQEIRWSESEVSLEQYAVDAVVQLFFEPVNRVQRRRFLEVLKVRGQSFQSGRHSMEITNEGIKVYPIPLPRGRERELSMRRIATGVPGLDRMLGGGFLEGFATLVAGETGTGKSTLARQFIAHGVLNGESGLYVSLREDSQRILQSVRTIGIDLMPALKEGNLIIHHVAGDVDAYKLFWEVKGLLEQREEEGRPIKRAAIDSLSDLVATFPDPTYLPQYLQAFVELFTLHGVTSVFTLSVTAANSAEHSPIDPDLARGLDCILMLRYMLLHDHIRKVMTVVKMRGSEHDTGIRTVRINDGEGMLVETGFEGMPSFIRKLQQLAQEHSGDVHIT
ncbi:MAG: ATPase domain-containing protein [Armatimonadota bacterium]